MKLWEIFRFEVYYQLRRPTTWIYFLAIIGLVLLVVDEISEYSRTVDQVLLNSPITVAEITGYANKFGLLLIAVLVADGAMRDIHARMDPLLYTSSITRSSYLAGRFIATVAICSLLIALTVPIALIFTKITAGAQPQRSVHSEQLPIFNQSFISRYQTYL